MTLFLKMLEWEIAGNGYHCWLIDTLRHRLIDKVLWGQLSAIRYAENMGLFYYL